MRDPKIDPEIGDELRGLRDYRLVMQVNICYPHNHKLAKNNPYIQYRLKNQKMKLCSLQTWRKWASTTTFILTTKHWKDYNYNRDSLAGVDTRI